MNITRLLSFLRLRSSLFMVTKSGTTQANKNSVKWCAIKQTTQTGTNRDKWHLYMASEMGVWTKAAMVANGRAMCQSHPKVAPVACTMMPVISIAGGSSAIRQKPVIKCKLFVDLATSTPINNPSTVLTRSEKKMNVDWCESYSNCPSDNVSSDSTVEFRLKSVRQWQSE